MEANQNVWDLVAAATPKRDIKTAELRRILPERKDESCFCPATRFQNVGDNAWLHDRNSDAEQELMACASHALNYEVLESEEAVGQAMFAELVDAAARTADDLTVVILGGRGGQALHRLLGEKAKTNEIDGLLSRLNVFTQDALAPMRMDNAFSFVRDFERLLGGILKVEIHVNAD